MPFEIGKFYTFNTLSPSLLGAEIKNAKHLATMDYDMARAFDNIDLKYRQIYPSLPPGTPNTVQGSLYHRFLSESGDKIILADQWIDESSIITVAHITIQVVYEEASLADIDRIRNLNNAAGYTKYTIKQI